MIFERWCIQLTSALTICLTRPLSGDRQSIITSSCYWRWWITILLYLGIVMMKVIGHLLSRSSDLPSISSSLKGGSLSIYIMVYLSLLTSNLEVIKVNCCFPLMASDYWCSYVLQYWSQFYCEDFSVPQLFGKRSFSSSSATSTISALGWQYTFYLILITRLSLSCL